MNISEIFSDSFKYPVSDIRKFAIFGIVVVLATLNVSIANSSVLQIILNVVSFVAIILILGYGLDVVNYAFRKCDDLPDFDFKTGFVNGLKLFVIQFCYFIVPINSCIYYSLFFWIFTVFSRNNKIILWNWHLFNFKFIFNFHVNYSCYSNCAFCNFHVVFQYWNGQII